MWRWPPVSYTPARIWLATRSASRGARGYEWHDRRVARRGRRDRAAPVSVRARAALAMLMRLATVAGACLIAATLAVPASADPPPPPTKSQCEAVRAHRSLPPIRALKPRRGAPRVFAMQFKEDLANIVTY